MSAVRHERLPVVLSSFGKYRRLSVYAGRQWPSLVAIVLLVTGASALTAMQPWPLKLLADHALSGSPLPGVLRQYLSGASAAGLVLLAAGASLALFIMSSALEAGLRWVWTRA